MWVKILEARVKLPDCLKKGWVMEGFPQTREQALALQSIGVHPKHCGRYYRHGLLLVSFKCLLLKLKTLNYSLYLTGFCFFCIANISQVEL